MAPARSAGATAPVTGGHAMDAQQIFVSAPTLVAEKAMRRGSWGHGCE